MAALVSILLLALALGLSACGGGGDDEEVKASLAQALRGSIESADVNVDAQLSISGLKGFERPIRLQASGPYIAAAGTIPKLDLDITAGSPESGSTIQGGLLTTGDRAFLRFGSGYYEQPQADVARANKEIRTRGGRGTFAGVRLDPQRWITGAESRGETEVAGAKVERFSGKVDLAALLGDLNKVAARSSDVVGDASSELPDSLSPAEIKRLTGLITSPSFDIYVGKDDGLLRRMSGTLSLDVPAGQRKDFGGISNATLRLSLELSKVNGEQTVSAPRDSRPMSDLAKALGGIGALGAGALGQDTPKGSSADPQAYSDCLDRARPDDIKALDRCAALLK